MQALRDYQQIIKKNIIKNVSITDGFQEKNKTI